MKFEELFTDSFQQLRASFQTTEQLLQPMVGKMLSTDSRFCQEAVAQALISEEGMQRAAKRYHLGKSRSGETVFWMIDEQGRARDAIVGDSWASVLLKKRGLIDKEWCPVHCLFGLHLLVEGGGLKVEGDYSAADISHSSFLFPHSSKKIAIVESVRSCIVLSERMPKYLWMATGYLANLNARLFLPLKGHHIVCFTATDPTGDTYLLWLSVAVEARKYGIDITVSRLLEDRATPEQKAAKIDLADFLFVTQISQMTQIINS